ncbi:MAG: hypothetical protein WCW93_01000 [Candidatus Paceibacterota bacterium]
MALINSVLFAVLADSPFSIKTFKTFIFSRLAYSWQNLSWDSKLVPSICSAEETRT